MRWGGMKEAAFQFKYQIPGGTDTDKFEMTFFDVVGFWILNDFWGF